MKKKPNKRVVPRAASFIRIAKDLKVKATNYRAAAKDGGGYPDITIATGLDEVADSLKTEAKRLRAMR